MEEQASRRQYLLALGATGTVGLAGCSQSPGPDQSTVTEVATSSLGGANFEFEYDGQAQQVTVQFNGGADIVAGNLELQSSAGVQVVWSELGSTVANSDERITSEATATLGDDILNWDHAIGRDETIRVVHVGGDPATLGRFTPPESSTLTSTVPTDTPTPKPTDTPPSEPTDMPTPEPTDTPTPEPTDTPTPEPTDTPPSDTTPPSITAFSLSNPSGQELRTSFESDEELPTVEITISGTETTTLSRNDFIERISGGTYTYEATYEASADGEYTATLVEAADESGNNGGSGESVTISVNSDTLMADFETRRNITIESSTGELATYPVVLEGIDIGDADIESVRVVDEQEGRVIDYATQSEGSDVDVAFQTDISENETIERFALYYGNSDADDETEEWGSVRYHWYDSFEGESGVSPENWTESAENPPAEVSVDCTTSSEGSCSMYVDGQYVSEDSSIGNVESLPNRQYTLLEFDIRHMQDASQIRLTSADTVESGGGFDTTRIKYGEVDQFYSGEPVDIEYETWHTFRYEFTWDGNDVGWTHYLNGEEIDSVPTSENTDIGTISGVLFRQAAFGDGIHYIDNVKFFASAGDDLDISVGEAESV